MYDKEREYMLDLVRVTEAAALMAGRHMGKGDKDLVDGAAVDAMRGMLELINFRGTVVIGEGEKDRAPMLYIGEQVGKNSDWETDIAVDPVEGTRLVANGLPNALSIIVSAAKGSLAPIPSYYMEKIIVGPQAKDYIDLSAPFRENLRVVAASLGKDIRDLTVCILDRPRHINFIAEAREVGARIRLITDGDVAAGIATCLPNTGVDVLIGIGGSTEGVLTATAVKCLGGGMHARIWPRDKGELAEITKVMNEKELLKIYTENDLARGDNLVFAATGITDGDLLKGVRYYGHMATTNSLVMRARTSTVRSIETVHNLTKKTIRSENKKAEVKI